MLTDCQDLLPLADFIALKPTSYAFRIVICIGAFFASLDVESTVKRVIGFVIILLSGVGLLFTGINHGTIVDILLGVLGLAAAGYSWWYTRH